MMTGKQRRAALEDETNFFYTRRFPYRDGDPIKITEFEFNDLRIYRMDIYTTYFHYQENRSFYPDWMFCFYFVDGKHGDIEILNKTEVLVYMEKAEKKKEKKA